MSDLIQCDYNTTGPWQSNPVHMHKDGTWWWYDETWADEHGPHPTKEAADAACAEYCKKELGC